MKTSVMTIALAAAIFAYLNVGASAAASSNASQNTASQNTYPHELPHDRSLASIMNDVSGQLVNKAANERYPLAQKLGDKGWFSVDLSAGFNHNTIDWLPHQTELTRLTPGKKVYYGVPFVIADPEHGNCIALHSEHFRKAPKSVTVPVARKARVLYFLHACAWAKWGVTREYVVNYDDGQQVNIAVLPAGSMTGQSENIQDWYSGDNLVDKRHARFVALPDPQHPARLNAIRYIYTLEWENPHPAKTIKSITFQSDNGPSTLFIFAVTGHS